MSDAFEHVDEGLPASDRRTHSRQPVRTLAYVELDEGNGGIVLNASEGGLSVQAVMSLMEDSLPKMRFQLSQSKEWLETGARVVWANESRKVAGLEFVDLPEETRSHIREWLAGGAVETETGEPRERAAAYNDAHEQIGHQTNYQTDNQTGGKPPDLDRGADAIGKEPDIIGATPTPPADSAVAGLPVPARPIFGQAGSFQTKTQPPPSGSRAASNPERAWNVAGLIALLAIVSLVAGWMAGRGTFNGLLDNPWGTASSAKTARASLAPVSAGAGSPISDIEIVDVHNQHWTIPFNPVAGTNPGNSHGQAAPVEWPAFNPAATVPEVQAPAAGDDAGSRKPNPPEVAASGNAASIPVPSESPDPRDLTPPAPKPEPQAARPPGTLQRGALIYHVDPVYPEIARDQNVQGTVKLDVTIGITGAVRSVVAVSGPGLLIEAARSAVRQWRYTPSLLDGKPVESQEYVSVVFQLPSTSK
jgi:TonB family protein